MRRFKGIMGPVVCLAVVAGVLISLIVPGCVDQNQDNSPISVNNSSGRPALSVTCSQDGSVAYLTDGRNVYRCDRNASGAGASWECILSYGQRLEMAAKHDPREQSLLDSFLEQTSDAKPGPAESQNKSK